MAKATVLFLLSLMWALCFLLYAGMAYAETGTIVAIFGFGGLICTLYTAFITLLAHENWGVL